MVDEIKIMLGDAAASYTEEQIALCLKQSMIEVEAYCSRDLDPELELIAQRIAIIKLNRLNTEGLASQSYSGTSESYVDGYPADIMAVLDRKRRRSLVVF